ncbi:MAG: hypothetical protein NWE99_08465 [Candidatus Bathyarchaeota archaeon]|nr:hypothetical protein [Candidatus Bathyarchaeota archaeon]
MAEAFAAHYGKKLIVSSACDKPADRINSVIRGNEGEGHRYFHEKAKTAHFPDWHKAQTDCDNGL